MPNSDVIKRRIALASEIIEKLDTQVSFTPANRGMGLVTDALGLSDYSQKVANVYNVWPAEHYGNNTPTPIVLANTVSEGAGNCDMKALVAYSLVANRPVTAGVANTKMMTVQIPGHTFCLLCDDAIVTVSGTAYGIAHFGEEAVVCDGWQSDYYAPNVWWPYGRIPFIEAKVWRSKIAANMITVVKVHSFYMP